VAPRLGAVVRLIRVPGCVTAAADSATAALVVATVPGRPAGAGTLALVGLASAGIYAFGIVIGDLRDVAKDMDRHPGRPLPSGAMSRDRARGVAGTAGVLALAAAAVVGAPTLVLAALTAGAVVLHQVALRRTDGGASLGMALCRVLNLLIGASAVGAWSDLPTLVALATGLYVLALTGISAFEDRRGPRPLFTALVVLLLTAILVPFPAFPEPVHRGFALATAAPLFLILLRRAALARERRNAPDVGRLVGRSVTGILLLDATYLFGFGHAPAAVGTVLVYLLVRLVLGPRLST